MHNRVAVGYSGRLFSARRYKPNLVNEDYPNHNNPDDGSGSEQEFEVGFKLILLVYNPRPRLLLSAKCYISFF
jgi:hypothetical protein